MRTETLWQGRQRAARTRWWREVLGRPAMAGWDELVDEMMRVQIAGGGVEMPAQAARPFGGGDQLLA